MPAEVAFADAEMKHVSYTAKLVSIDREARTIVARISTDIVDRDKEVLLPKGAILDFYRKNPVVLWAHEYNSKPIGRALWVKIEGPALLAKVEFAPSEEAMKVFELYADKYLNAWSVGFLPVDGKGHAPTEQDIRQHPDWAGARWIHEEWDLLEFSAVSVPSNPNALALAVSKGLSLPTGLEAAKPKGKPTVARLGRKRLGRHEVRKVSLLNAVPTAVSLPRPVKQIPNPLYRVRRITSVAKMRREIAKVKRIGNVAEIRRITDFWLRGGVSLDRERHV